MKMMMTREAQKQTLRRLLTLQSRQLRHQS